jgi:FixJ family two-component response regulator
LAPIQKTIVGIVDDDPEVRKAVRRMLSAFGYISYVFDSADAFLRTAATSKANCLVVDIQLGDISGVEMGRQLTETGFTFPIIFMTGSDDEITRTQATQLGCVDYLRKPFSADRLIEAIVKAIG